MKYEMPEAPRGKDIVSRQLRQEELKAVSHRVSLRLEQ